MSLAGKLGLRTQWRSPLRAAVAVALAAVIVLLGAQAASAHAELLSSTPTNGEVFDEAPTDVVLSFNEPVQLIDGSLRLFPGEGAPLTLSARITDADVSAPLPATLADGRYVLSYRVVSADGHPISGALTFTIGDDVASAARPQVETETPAATRFVLSTLTALQYIGLLLFTGLIFFERVVRKDGSQASALSHGLVRGSAITAAAASILFIPASALNVSGLSLPAVLSPAQWISGVLWAPVAAGVVIVVGVLAASALARRAAPGPWPRALLTATLLVTLAAPVLVGHTQLVEPRALVIAADFGHLVAGAFWVGGSAGLVLFLTQGRKTGTDAELAAQVVRRFSRYAIWSVAVLAVTGTVMGIMIVGSVDALITTPYGLTLLLKVAIVIPVIGIAAYNRIRLLPTLETQSTHSEKWRMLSRTLSYEAALLIVVLAVTGSLTNLSPDHAGHESGAQAAAAEIVSVDAAAQELTVVGTLTPALVGDNDLTFTLTYEGEPVAPEQVSVEVTLPENDLGPFQVMPVLERSSGEYTARLALPVAGEWQVRVLARVSTFDQPIVTIPITIR